MDVLFWLVLVVVLVAVAIGFAWYRHQVRSERSLPDTLPQGRESTPEHTISAALEDEVRVLLAQGQKIAAIKLYREQTGLGLKQAKEAVERLQR